MFPVQGVLCASVRCGGRSGEEVNKAWSQISLHCPLLLFSTAVLCPLLTAIHTDVKSLSHLQSTSMLLGAHTNTDAWIEAAHSRHTSIKREVHNKQPSPG